MAQDVQAQSANDLLNSVLGGKKSTTTQNNGRPGSTNGTNNSTTSGNNTTSGNLSNTQIVSGLKEALRIGANNAAGKLSLTDGFFKNTAIKILMPAEVQQVEKTLRSVGMGSVVDKAILAMNRAAEDASKQAAPIFVNAITTMSLQDGVGILTGGNTAATNYLKLKTTDALTQAFRPIIQSSLQKVGATNLWKTVFTTYNQLPLVAKKVNPDLSGYVVEKAMDGMFYSISQEEAKIRTNPAAQVTSLLQQVFGNKR
ncbi:DUF4197 domain-containing protein [Taibaiella sp. KBW10]|nr:DUF4197 domain-containing protein [Taibaiella sp. KBW10]